MATVSNYSSSILQRIDSDTRDVINYLSLSRIISSILSIIYNQFIYLIENRDEICDLYIDEITSANKIQISEWEIVRYLQVLI